MRQRGFEFVTGWEQRAVLPRRATASSAGYDLAAAEGVTIAPGASVLVPTGVKAYMQPDEVLYVYIRSSMAVKRGLVLTNSVGVIDADYYNSPESEGQIFVALTNRGTEPVTIAAGERIAQAVFHKYLTVDGDTAGEGAERQGGWGSTGRGTTTK